jgi:hypothetical protein
MNFSSSDEVALSALSHKLLCVAGFRREIDRSFAKSSFGELTSSFQKLVCGLADDAQGERNLKKYWDEKCKERLAALNGPYDVFQGISHPRSVYRSSFLNALRDNASRRTYRVLDPTLEEFYLLPRTDNALINFRRHVLEVKVANGKKFSDTGAYERDAIAWRGLSNSLILLLVRELALLGFKEDAVQKSGFTARNENVIEGYDFLIALPFDNDFCYGRLHPSLLVALKGKTVSPQFLERDSLACFDFEDIVPGFRYNLSFDPEEYGQLVFTIKSVSCLISELLESFRRCNGLNQLTN